MFVGELLLGLGFGSVIGLGARLIFKEGAVVRPDLNTHNGVYDYLEYKSDEMAAQITFDGPDDLETK